MKTLLSTKKLSAGQKELILNAGISYVAYDAIKIEFLPFSMPKHIKNAIFTSKNAVKSFFLHSNASSVLERGDSLRLFCVGDKTAGLLREKGLKIEKTAKYGEELAHFIANNYNTQSFHFFCGNRRRDVIPNVLNDANIPLSEVETYRTSLHPREFNRHFDALLFYSPSGIESFISANKRRYGSTPVFCIGQTTAAAAEPHFNTIYIANSTRVESVIAKAVLELKRNHD